MAQLNRYPRPIFPFRSLGWLRDRPIVVGILVVAGAGSLILGSGLYGLLKPSGLADPGASSGLRFSSPRPDQIIEDAHLPPGSSGPDRMIGISNHVLMLQSRFPRASGSNSVGLKQPLLPSRQLLHHSFTSYRGNLLGILLVLAVCAGMTFAILDARKALRRAHGDIRRLRKATVTVKAMTFVAIAHDDETGAHLQRCSLYAKVLGRQLQLEGMPINDEYVEALAVAVPLHDIGKVGIPDHVLKKPGKHSAEEQATMRLHPEIGRRIISLLSEEADIHEKLVFEIAKDVTIAHHENWDGSGYPAGHQGENIPFAARIMAIIDVYDAVSSRRCYKEPRTHEEVLKIIRGLSGTKFDPVLVSSFLSVSDEFRRIFEQNPDHAVINEFSRGSIAEPAVSR